MSQKNFGKVIGIKTSTVNKRESEGLLNIVEIYNLCEKIGLDPREKLIEMLEQAESLKTQTAFKIKERNTTIDH
jgi:DNA-binding XRE family transcriptional regulator